MSFECSCGDWHRKKDPTTGSFYYANSSTLLSRWTIPSEWVEPPTPEGAPPPLTAAESWREATDPNTGFAYYVNTMTMESSWTRPKEMARSSSTASSRNSDSSRNGRSSNNAEGGEKVLTRVLSIKKLDMPQDDPETSDDDDRKREKKSDSRSSYFETKRLESDTSPRLRQAAILARTPWETQPQTKEEEITMIARVIAIKNLLADEQNYFHEIQKIGYEFGRILAKEQEKGKEGLCEQELKYVLRNIEDIYSVHLSFTTQIGAFLQKSKFSSVEEMYLLSSEICWRFQYLISCLEEPYSYYLAHQKNFQAVVALVERLEQERPALKIATELTIKPPQTPAQFRQRKTCTTSPTSPSSAASSSSSAASSSSSSAVPSGASSCSSSGSFSSANGSCSFGSSLNSSSTSSSSPPSTSLTAGSSPSISLTSSYSPPSSPSNSPISSAHNYNSDQTKTPTHNINGSSGNNSSSNSNGSNHNSSTSSNNSAQIRSFAYFLELPYSRPSAYGNLFLNILKTQDPCSEGFRLWNDVLEVCESMVIKIEQNAQQIASKELVAEIQKRLYFSNASQTGLKLVTPTRCLIQSGEIKKKLAKTRLGSSYKTYMLYVFNDMAMYTSLPDKLKRIVPKRCMSMIGMKVVASEKDVNFTITSIVKNVQFKAATKADRDKWVRVLQENIKRVTDTSNIRSPSKPMVSPGRGW